MGEDHSFRKRSESQVYIKSLGYQGNVLSCASGVSSAGKGPSAVFLDVFTELFVPSAMFSGPLGLGVALVISAGVALTGGVACTASSVHARCLGVS